MTLDHQGLLLIVTAVACSVLMAHWSGTEYSWSEPVILGLAPAALAAWALFFRSQARRGALVPLWLFRSRIVNLATVTGPDYGRGRDVLGHRLHPDLPAGRPHTQRHRLRAAAR